MNLPVKDLETSIPFYETIMAFQVVLRKDAPYKSAILGREGIQIGLAQNGGDPSQEGCFFEVDDVEASFEELKSNGLQKEISDFNIEQHGETSWKIFYVVAPDGLCYCFGERQN
jgi:catechol 2,3-dioxygenase-like lactoylglutathione lyase family enzyme